MASLRLGVLAYKAYGNWQASRAPQPSRAANPGSSARRRKSSSTARPSCKALVAAAKADGHVDERERELIEGEFTRSTGDKNCSNGCTPN